MSLPSYQVLFISPDTGEITHVLDTRSFYELKYSRVINETGKLAMTLPGDVAWEDEIPLDTFIEVYRTSPVTEELIKEDTYLARYFQRSRVDTHEQFVLGGVSLNHLLWRRIIDPDDDPGVAGGYSTKAGPADQVIYDYAYEQAGPGASIQRRIAGLSVATVLGTATPVGAHKRYENLLETLQDLSERGITDFIVNRTTDNLTELVIGPHR